MRPRGLAAYTAVMVLVVAGCGGGGVGGGYAGPAQTATPEASDTAAATDTPTEEEVVLLTQEQAQAALPVVTDLPTGWADDPEDTAGGGDDSDQQISPTECDAVFNADLGADAVVEASASFTMGELGPWLGVDVASYEPGTEPTEAEVAEVPDLLAGSCPTFTLTDPDGTVAQVTPAGLSFPALGDAHVALRFNVTSDAFDLTVDLVYVVSGNNAVGVSGLGIATNPVDVALTEQVMRQTLDKVDAAAAT